MLASRSPNVVLTGRCSFSLFRRSVLPFSKLRHRVRSIAYDSLGATAAMLDVEVNSLSQNLAQHAELLQAFYDIPSMDKAWGVLSEKGGIDFMVSMSQADFVSNKKRTFISHVYIPEGNDNFHWSPFPVELKGASIISSSPSGKKLLVAVNNDNKDAPWSVKLQIWGATQLLHEIYVQSSIHRGVYNDGWFEGISWSHDEEYIAYIAEEPTASRPVFGPGCSEASTLNREGKAGTWKGCGDWMEDWGESYSGKGRPLIAVANISSGVVQVVQGIPKDISAGQVIWAPLLSKNIQYLVFVGWNSYSSNFETPRKLGIKYCQNRPCGLYTIEFMRKPPKEGHVSMAQKLTESIPSAFSPCFSPDGDTLVFLSAKAAVDSGVHCATNSLHCICWPPKDPQPQIKELVSVVMQPERKGFPGLYCTSLVSHPWLDNSTLLLSSIWHSTTVILAVDITSGFVQKVTPDDSIFSWGFLTVQNKMVIAVASSPVDPPVLKLGLLSTSSSNWLDISPPLRLADKVQSMLQSKEVQILEVYPSRAEDDTYISKGAKEPFEAFLVSSKLGTQNNVASLPLILYLHGGPHSASVTKFSGPLAFISGLGYNLLHVNYRGSLGFGEESLQCLPGHIGQQDVADVLAALDLVIRMGLADPKKVAVIGGSHGGFLATHLIGQAPDRFLTAVVRNPVCNLTSMVGVTDIPDWCFVESFGRDASKLYSEAPSAGDLKKLYELSPVLYLSKVKAPTLFLLGAQDRRVPVSNGIQYAYALKARGVEVKIILFPEDTHAIDRPQSELESFANIGIWLNRFF